MKMVQGFKKKPIVSLIYFSGSLECYLGVNANQLLISLEKAALLISNSAWKKPCFQIKTSEGLQDIYFMKSLTE